jgi:hypothetical protein
MSIDLLLSHVNRYSGKKYEKTCLFRTGCLGLSMPSHDVCNRFILFFKLGYDPFMVRVASVLAQLERRLDVGDVNPKPDDALHLSLHRFR